MLHDWQFKTFIYVNKEHFNDITYIHNDEYIFILYISANKEHTRILFIGIY